MEMERAPGQGALLAEAFSDFIAASARLEVSYRELQAEVSELSQALQERNRALSASLSEKRHIGRKLDRILQAIPCGVLVVQGGGEVRLANAEAERLLGLAAGSMPTLKAIRGATGLNLELNPQQSAAGAGSDEAEQELSFAAAGVRHWVAVRRVCLPAPEKSRGHEAAETVLTLRDVSARKRMELEREAARDAVALSQVSALLAHEIRNPLASLELFAALIPDTEESWGEWLWHLRAGIRSLTGMVNNVLTLHGRVTLPMERVEIGAEIALAAAFLQPLAQQAGVALGLESPAAELWAWSNRSALQQILLNLCSNALRHTAAGGQVRLLCSPNESGAIRITVEDNGCGIAAEHLPRLFEAGFSGSGASSGLGLAVCQRLVKEHGGTIRVQSDIGQGSRFTVELPRA